MSLDESQLKLAVYSSDVWGHVCPVVRLTGPAFFNGLQVLKGNDWADGALTFSLDPIDQADLVVVLRDFPRYTAEYRQVVQKARAAGKKIVYGIDDLLIELPEGHPDAVHYRAARYLILGAILEADAVFVTTPQLREALLQYNPRIQVLPNYLNDQIWKLPETAARKTSEAERKNSGPVVIGYQGGMGHLPDLEMITPALVNILQRYGNRVKFKFWGALPPAALREWPNVEWLNVGLVDYAEFVQYFQAQECDLAIAPIANHLFNACKSPLKFFEYSAMALPGIYSRVAPYASVVTAGEDGLLVETVQQWEEALVRLIEDPALRQQIGQAAQQTVRQRWLLSEHAWEWTRFFSSVLAQPALPRMPAEMEAVVLASQRWSISMDRTLAEQSRQFAETLRRNEEASDAQILELKTHLSNIQGSLGWRLLMKAHRIADKVIPAGSLHGRLVRGGLRLIKNPVRKKPQAAFIPQNGESLYVVGDHASSPLLVQLRSGTPLSSPGISLLLPCGAGLAQVSEAEVLAWLEKQTYRDIELVRWEVGSDPAELLRQLRGKYTCAASHDLLQQPATYLETNLIALESEGLAFTVNATGSAEWMVDRLKAGSLPGSAEMPLLRQVARSECLAADFSIDLARLAGQAGGRPWVAGKLLVHTAGKMDHRTALPYNLNLVGASVSMLGSYLVAHSAGRELPPGMIPHPVYDIDQVLPKTALPSEQPTVFVVMPFLAVGGAETVHLHVLRYLQPRARFVLITFEPHASALGTTVEEFRAITPYIYTLPDYLLYHHNFSLMRYLIERYRPDCLYVANGATWIYNALADLRRLYPNLLVANQVYDHQAGWINRYDSDLVKQIDAHISINDLIDKAYIDAGARPEQVFHIENGVDTGYFDPACYSNEEREAIRARLGLPAGRKVVTMMGRLHPQKRPVDFLEIARRCGDDPAVIFLMVGDGPLSDTVNQQLQLAPLPNFYRRSFYKPSRDIFAISDVIVLTSEYEGMPMVVLEAQSMGRPVVATDVGNIRQVLEKTGGGQTVARIGDIGGLVAAIRQVLAAPPSPGAVRQAVIEQYSLEQMAEGYARALRLK